MPVSPQLLREQWSLRWVQCVLNVNLSCKKARFSLVYVIALISDDENVQLPKYLSVSAAVRQTFVPMQIQRVFRARASAHQIIMRRTRHAVSCHINYSHYCNSMWTKMYFFGCYLHAWCSYCSLENSPGTRVSVNRCVSGHQHSM